MQSQFLKPGAVMSQTLVHLYRNYLFPGRGSFIIQANHKQSFQLRTTQNDTNVAAAIVSHGEGVSLLASRRTIHHFQL